MAQFSLELRFRVAFLAVLLPLASGACVDLDLGMGRGTIPNSNITASSVQSATTPAKNGRLNYTSGSSWCARTNYTHPYLQIDLQTLHIICAVSTQGNSQADQWVKNYTLQFSTNGTTWTDYKEGGQVKFLRGNDDRNSEVKHVVYGVLTRYLRFLPNTYQGRVCMRAEVFGVEQKLRCSMQAIGVAKSDTIPDSSFSASSEFVSVYAAKYGRLNNTKSWAPRRSNNGNDYLQIDLLSEYVICAVATQGNPRAREWTTKYKFQLSLNSSKFVTYQENNADKVFPGNSNQNGIVKNSLQEVAIAKFIRFQPTTYRNYKGLRVEVYGIILTKVPSQPPTDFKLIASSSTSIMASWKLPPVLARHGRTITGFILFYKKKISGVPATKLNIMDGSTLSRNVTGLDEYTEYEFQVLAYTTDGNGPKSPVEVERTKEAAPSRAPSSFNAIAVTSTIITASWHLPPADSRNGVIKGFKLFYKKRGSTGSETLPINNGTAFSKDVIGLDNNTEYEFEVLAFTSVGDGPKSPVVVVRTRKYGGCDEFNLGMEDGTIPNNTVTASSEQSASTSAKSGRLNYTSGSSWCARTSDSKPHLQIDLQTLHIICAVSTQGNSRADQWVTTYRLQLSTDGTTWRDYKEGGQVKALRGNNDRYSEVKHVVYGVLTRYLRFLPQTHQGGVCMRTEVFGVKQKPICNMEAIGLASGGTIPSSSFTATSFYNHRYKPFFGRLNADKWGWGPKTKTNPADYIQIDLLYEYFICAVATQGSYGSNEWTTEYKVHLSLDGTTFFAYKETSTDKLFPGNSNKNGVVKNSLQEFARAKIIRFQPISYHNWPVLRVEVYGILLTTTVPSKPPTAFKLTASSSTSIKASWQLPPVFARHGRNITGFKLFCKKKGSGRSAATLTIRGGSTLNRLVTGLDYYTEYEFQVLAFTSAGDGPKSSVEVERTMEDAPSQPPSNFTVTAISSTSVTGSWQLPPGNSRNGIIKGFKLFYKRKDSSGLGTILPINNESSLNINVTGLYKYTEYEFQVLAFTSVGDGPKSSVVVERTKEDVPSQPPSGFNLTATSPTSITASWQLPPEHYRNGIIRGFKLLYKKKGASGSGSVQHINNQTTRTQDVTGLDKFTEYEFQILAFTSVGNGPKSTAIFEKTKEAAPSAPISLSSVDVPPSNLHGPRITLSWSKPTEPNGVIRSYTLFYSHGGGAPKGIPGIDKDTLRHTVDVLGGVTYRFYVRAVTIKPGANGTITVTTKEYKPSVGPDSLFSSQVNKTTLNISWEPLQKEMSYGRVTLYEVKANVWWTAHFHNWSAPSNITANTSATFVVLFDLVCYKYNVSVRAYTGAGPGPYSEPLVLVTSMAETPEKFRAADYGTTHVTLTWQHSDRKESVTYTVNYNGTKFYDKSFKHVGAKKTNSTTFTVIGLFPGTSYKFEVYGSSDCGQTATKSVYITTHIMAPNSPLPLNMTDVEVSETAVDIYLWPVEQENGPISAYQVIVLKVVNGVEDLPGDYGSQLKAASDAKKDNLNFYIAAEIENLPVIEKPWKFTVGDGEKTANYKNEILESGESYIVYERALTKTKDGILEGKVSKVAKITISPANEKATRLNQGGKYRDLSNNTI